MTTASFPRTSGWLMLALVLMPSYAMAEERVRGQIGIGSKLGLQLSRYSGDDASTPVVRSTNRRGIAIGGLVSLDVHELATLQLEPTFATRGESIEISGVHSGANNLRYIDLSLLAQIRIPLPGPVTPYLVAGMRPSWLVGATLETTDGIVTDVKHRHTSIDVGVIAGLGASIALTGGHSLLIEARFDQGLRAVFDLEKTYDSQNRTIAFLLGHQYRISSAPATRRVSQISPPLSAAGAGAAAPAP